MKLTRLSSLLLAALLATPAAMAQRIHDVVVTADGSEYAGYISHQDLQKGLITVQADYLIRSISPAKCRVGEERIITLAQLSPEAQDWYRKQSGAELTPDTPVSVRDVQETAGESTLWRDAFVLEEGRIIKFIVFGRTFQLDADNVRAIRHAERPADATEGIVDVFITRGLSVPEVEGQLIEESVGEFYRVLIKGADGSRDRIINISADNVLSRSKRPLNPEMSMYRQAPLVDELRTASGESIRGVIATMDMTREELVVVTESGVSRIVKAADVASITSAPAAELAATAAPAAELAATAAPAAELAATAIPAAELTATATPAAELAATAAPAAAAPVLGASASSTISTAPPSAPIEITIPALEAPEAAAEMTALEESTKESAADSAEESAAEEAPTPTAADSAEESTAEEAPTPIAAEEALDSAEGEEEAEEDPEDQFFEQAPDDNEDDEAEAFDSEEAAPSVSSAQSAAEPPSVSPSAAAPSSPTPLPIPASAAKAQFYVCKKPVTPVEVVALPNGYWSLQGEAVAIDHKGSDAYIEVPIGVASNDAIEVYLLTETTSGGTAYPHAFSPAESAKAPRVKVASSQRPVPGHKRLTFQLSSPGRYAIYRPADKMVMWFEWK